MNSSFEGYSGNKYESANWDFESISPQEKERISLEAKLRDQQKRKDAAELKEKLVKVLGDVQELKSDYLGTSSYYYKRSEDKIYEIDNYNVTLSIPSLDVQQHLRELNKLS